MSPNEYLSLYGGDLVGFYRRKKTMRLGEAFFRSLDPFDQELLYETPYDCYKASHKEDVVNTIKYLIGEIEG